MSKEYLGYKYDFQAGHFNVVGETFAFVRESDVKLAIASIVGRADEVARLIQKEDANPNAIEHKEEKRSILMLACTYGNSYDAVQTLIRIKDGAKLDYYTALRFDSGPTCNAFSLALAHGKDQAARALIENGATLQSILKPYTDAFLANPQEFIRGSIRPHSLDGGPDRLLLEQFKKLQTQLNTGSKPQDLVPQLEAILLGNTSIFSSTDMGDTARTYLKATEGMQQKGNPDFVKEVTESRKKLSASLNREPLKLAMHGYYMFKDLFFALVSPIVSVINYCRSSKAERRDEALQQPSAAAPEQQVQASAAAHHTSASEREAFERKERKESKRYETEAEASAEQSQPQASALAYAPASHRYRARHQQDANTSGAGRGGR